MKKLVSESIEIWRHSRAFRIYVLLLIAAFIKQLVHETQLVDGAELLAASHNLWNFGIADACLPGMHCDHWLHETRRTLGYPALIIMTFFVSKIIMFLQVLLAILIPAISQRLILVLQLPISTFKYFLWFFVLYPLQYFYTSLLMPELFCQVLFLLGILFFVQKKFINLSMVVSVLVLLKPIFILLIPIIVLYLLFDIKNRILLVLPLLLFLLVSLYNKSHTGIFHYSSIGVENAFEYNAHAVLNKSMSSAELENYNIKMDLKLDHLNFQQKYKLMQSETNDILINNWLWYAFLHAKGCLLALVDPGRYDLVAFLELPEGAGFMNIKKRTSMVEKIGNIPWYIILYMAFFAILNICKLGLIFFIKKMEFKKMLPIILLLILFIGVTGPVGSARYLFPFMPIICILAANGFVEILKKYGKSSVAL